MRASRRARARAPLGRATVVALLATLALSGVAGAGRPLDTEDTGVLDPGRVELELGWEWARSGRDDTWTLQDALALGVLPGLQFEFQLPVLFVDPEGALGESGVGDAQAHAKYRLLEETDRRPAVLGWTFARLPTGDEGRGLGEEDYDVSLFAIVGKSWGPLTLAWNGGHTFVLRDRDLDFFTLSAALEYQVARAWTLVGEAVGEVGVDRERADTLILRGGAVWALGERVRLDAGVGAGVTRETPDVIVTLGITLGPF